jgi:hypothetical protein
VETSEYRQGPSAPGGPAELVDARELDRVYRERTFDLETLQPDEASQQTLRDLVIRWSDRISQRPAYTLAWPPGLYIPAEADWRQYWITKPPASNLYRRDRAGRRDVRRQGPRQPRCRDQPQLIVGDLPGVGRNRL